MAPVTQKTPPSHESGAFRALVLNFKPAGGDKLAWFAIKEQDIFAIYINLLFLVNRVNAVTEYHAGEEIFAHS